MTKFECNQIIHWASTLSNEQLEKEYYNAIYDALGSQVDEMEEQDWDEIDIKERRKFEKWLGEKSDLLEKLCDERGIELWRKTNEKH